MAGQMDIVDEEVQQLMSIGLLHTNYKCTTVLYIVYTMLYI